jgi:polyferredoxin/ferredoxin
MKIVQTRRISQIFFFTLFVWLVVIASVGDKFWQIRSWPVNLFLQLDPLVAIGTMLTTHSLFAPLLWALPVVILTIILGRFFCGWVCPFGSIHHFVGFLAHRKRGAAEKVRLNKYRPAQSIKYIILVVLLAMAAFPSFAATLVTGLLDPIPLVTRSFNLIILPLADGFTHVISPATRFAEGAFLILLVFAAAILLNLVIPRFYCRFVCPLGAFFAILDRFAIWRIGKRAATCPNCKQCETNCEGGCEPMGNIKISECVLCMNCLDRCSHDVIAYATRPSACGEVTKPDFSRRAFALSFVGGIVGLGALRLANKLGTNWYYKLIRPPGSLPEPEFLKRCIKCGQCMRICPTNVIQPAGLEDGLEGLWTPVLNNRIGSSGCQMNCVACSQVCPTAAIRPITLDEKLGIGEFAKSGPIKLGTAFVDRNRCLPWAMDKPCLVCHEVCPVPHKAIFTRESFSTTRFGRVTLTKNSGLSLEVKEHLRPGSLSGGDYYCLMPDGRRYKIESNTQNNILIASGENFEKNPAEGDTIQVQVRLLKPYVDVERCIGCGVCEHDCPVSGLRGVRVSAEGESRSNDRRLLLNS